jgi:hypothetical protein
MFNKFSNSIYIEYHGAVNTSKDKRVKIIMKAGVK